MNEFECRLEFGKAVVVEIDGREAIFRPLARSEALKISKLMLAGPEACTAAAFELCEAACVSDPAALACLMNEYPLAFATPNGVIGELIKVAHGDAKIRIQSAKQEWKAGDRNPGLMAENLLAFKAYQGGDWTARQLAGALTIAEWMGSTKGIFNLFLALMKSLSKR